MEYRWELAQKPDNTPLELIRSSLGVSEFIARLLIQRGVTTFDQAKELMIEMSENYKDLLELFPENSKEGFKTGSLPIIWEDKENFNTLMQKSSDDMIKLTSIIETVGDVNIPIRELMWGNCKACHSKYREEH